GRVAPVEPVVNTRVLSTTAHEAAGATSIRSSLRPLFSGGTMSKQSSDELRRENAKACLTGHKFGNRNFSAHGLPSNDPIQCGPNKVLRVEAMKKLAVAIVLVVPLVASWPSLAQTKLTPKGATARTDNCAPIGRTANGELVYSMKCESLPAPPPAPQAEMK